MTGKYRLREKAVLDLERIWFYTFNKWSVEQADRYHRLIISEIEYIANNFDLSREMYHVRWGYRMTKVKSHLIFFKKSEDDKIQIIRILYQNMDIENRLKGNE